MNETPTFAYVLRLTRREAFGNFSPKEQAVVDEHFEYLKKGLAEKRVILAGPCLDGEFGIVIFRATSIKDAESFMKNDPAIKKGVMAGDLHSFRVSIMEKE
ncbi:MAG: YciI family protein [Promethearchaeati archaeon SRVP18_Atabeyarchaeia-1]